MYIPSLLSLPCDPARARTVDPLIKSQLLYQLSYGVNFWDCKYNVFLQHA